MYLLGYSLDNLSLMALTLCVGFVVDDAIVMLENIVRHMEMGKTPHARRRSTGSSEIGFTIVSMTLSLAAVFIPVLFMGGIVGRLLHEFAVTISVAILISGVVSLTLTPMLCSRFLRPPHARRTAGSTAPPSASSTGCCGSTTARCAWALRHRRVTMAVAGRHVRGDRRACSSIIPKGFIPTEDTGHDLRVHRGRAGHLVRGDGARTSRRSPTIVRQQPERRAVHVVRSAPAAPAPC